jgi:hypothetical protein
MRTMLMTLLPLSFALHSLDNSLSCQQSLRSATALKPAQEDRHPRHHQYVSLSFKGNATIDRLPS